jgi:hypothetical protein
VSLKSRKSIDSAGPDIHEEVAVTWQRNPDKSYTKVTKITHRDRKTGGVKPMKMLKPTEEGPFTVVSSKTESDDSFYYLDIDGKPTYVWLRKIDDEDFDADA